MDDALRQLSDEFFGPAVLCGRENCEALHYGRGLCKRHWRQMYEPKRAYVPIMRKEHHPNEMTFGKNLREPDKQVKASGVPFGRVPFDPDEARMRAGDWIAW
jgi:hypothetical protein